MLIIAVIVVIVVNARKSEAMNLIKNPVLEEYCLNFNSAFLNFFCLVYGLVNG